MIGFYLFRLNHSSYFYKVTKGKDFTSGTLVSLRMCIRVVTKQKQKNIIPSKSSFRLDFFLRQSDDKRVRFDSRRKSAVKISTVITVLLLPSPYTPPFPTPAPNPLFPSPFLFRYLLLSTDTIRCLPESFLISNCILSTNRVSHL